CIVGLSPTLRSSLRCAVPSIFLCLHARCFLLGSPCPLLSLCYHARCVFLPLRFFLDLHACYVSSWVTIPARSLLGLLCPLCSSMPSALLRSPCPMHSFRVAMATSASFGCWAPCIAVPAAFLLGSPCSLRVAMPAALLESPCQPH